MNRATRMLEVLRDGKPHARREIFERAGFMLTNNAASELREMGYDVRQSSSRVNGATVYSYRLHGSLDERDGKLGDAPLDSAGPESSRSSSESLSERETSLTGVSTGSQAESEASNTTPGLASRPRSESDTLDSLAEPDHSRLDPPSPRLGFSGTGRSGSASEPEQIDLFSSPRRPAWH